MSFGGFLDNTSPGGGGARIVADIPYNNNSMPTGGAIIAQPRLLSPSITKPMFNSPGTLTSSSTAKHRWSRRYNKNV
ncbi:hypothetical protein OIU77_010289 [Salix suchowensis]|uniref:Uncharacterized protein n=1 Tax=Salix suchowensis TaxID=1278906 RepID=A0ABQ9A7S2_9ROSI|nr:hypothetical protein OIU77_010289 [Salix suchowensis]